MSRNRFGQFATEPQATFMLDYKRGFPTAAEELGFSETEVSQIEGVMAKTRAHEILDGFDAYVRRYWGDHCAKSRYAMNRQTVAAELLWMAAASKNHRQVRKPIDYDRAVSLARRIGFQGNFRALVYSRHTTPDERRVNPSLPKSVPLQSKTEAEDEFRKTLSSVRNAVNRRLSLSSEDRTTPRPTTSEPVATPEPKPTDVRPTPVSMDEVEVEPVVFEPVTDPETIIAVTSEKIPADWLKVPKAIYNLGRWNEEHPIPGFQIDPIGMRPFIGAAEMLTAGLPIDAIWQSIRMGWPPEAYRATDFDSMLRYTPQHPDGAGEYERYTFDYRKFGERIPGLHRAAAYVLKLWEIRQPTLLVGPSGTGKTRLVEDICKHISEKFSRDYAFGFASMSRGTSPSTFNGRPLISDNATMLPFLLAMSQGDFDTARKISDKAQAAGNTVISQWQRIYGGGGAFLFDEWDGGDENLQLIVNAALANGRFSNSATGEIVKQHPDFWPVAAANTFGLGGTSQHNARNRQDHASLDRFRMGRVIILLDKDLAFEAFNKIVEAGRI
jgi:AAA domain (dynein-related subfamily)